jgi:hypothetical protein
MIVNYSVNYYYYMLWNLYVNTYDIIVGMLKF